MKTMRLFIVDDEAPARERLKTLLADIAADCPNQVVGEADNAQQALGSIVAANPDVVLLDVQMPGVSGVHLAADLARLPDAPAVVFVTAFEQYALSAFDVQAADYLLKPVRASRLAEALMRVARTRIGAQVAPPPATTVHVPVMERGRLLKVPLADVIFLKAEMKYLTLHTRERDYLIEGSLASFEESWPEVFVRVHRNALVAKQAIIGVARGQTPSDDDGKAQESWEVILKDSIERLPVSRRQWPQVKALLR
ncbi:MAG: response regulator transcription factor [Burkholderiaceae bacterium]|nr:response regulator transcription factor [Burkholderiaceae bacterium]